MYQRFLDNTSISNCIKNLLANTPVPLIRTLAHGDYMIEGLHYIHNNNVILCTKSGILMSEYDDSGDFENIEPFNFGVYYPTITEKFVSNTNSYDSDTHIHLGNYLRCIRDIEGINLMPLYNCYSEIYVPNLTLRLPETSESLPYYTFSDSHYKLVGIPIKFNTDYTIAIECSTPYLIMPMIIKKGNIINTTHDGYDVTLTSMLTKSVEQVNCSQFRSPYQYRIDNTDRFVQTFENDLLLVMQLPIKNTSSIVVLEGIYDNYNKVKISSKENLLQRDERSLYHKYSSLPSLLQMSDGNNYAFSDRLIEYLLYNVISSSDEISANIGMIQKSYMPQFLTEHKSTFGVWDNRMRDYLFDKAMGCDRLSKLDLTGFVDKDIEKMLNRHYDNPGQYQQWLQNLVIPSDEDNTSK